MLKIGGVDICCDRQHDLDSNVPRILPANRGKNETGLFIVQLRKAYPSSSSSRISKSSLTAGLLAGALNGIQGDRDHVRLLQFEDTKLKSRAVFCPTDLSEYYLRFHDGGEYSKSGWKDYYYATMFVALAVIEQSWKAKTIYLTHIRNGCYFPESMLEAQFDALEVASREQVSSVEKLCIHHLSGAERMENLKSAICAERVKKEEEEEVQFSCVGKKEHHPPESPGSKQVFTWWQVEVRNKLGKKSMRRAE